MGTITKYVLQARKPPSPPQQPPQQPPQEPPQQPPDSHGGQFIPPILPPLRLLRVWLSQSGPGGASQVSDSQPLVAGQWYNLHVQIHVRGLERAQERQQGLPTPLTVVYFAPKADFVLENNLARIEIPPSGHSSLARIGVRPLRPGRHSIRVCIYYRNVLLQSAVLDLGIVHPAQAGHTSAQPVHARLLDYVASPDLLRLEQFANPSLSIFTNESADGTHWIGLYSSSPTAANQPPVVELFTFTPYRLTQLAQLERNALATAQGFRGYRPDYPLPLDERSLAFFEQILVEMAINGFNLYNELFLNDPSGLGMDRLRVFDQVLRQPGLISIARCRGNATSLPWAALYAFPLAVSGPPSQRQSIHLCPRFKQELLANGWTGGTLTQPVRDHLDAPEACAASPGCPVRSGARDVVCPFGFWGFQHLIEQPLQLVRPTPVDTTPELLQKRPNPQETRLLWPPGNKLRCMLGANPRLTNIEEVYRDIQRMLPPDRLQIEYSTDGAQILHMIEEGGRHIYYFFCHGDVEQNVFRLNFFQSSISSASLYPIDIHWPAQPKPLFILNGCGTADITPEIMHGFLEKLHLLGASGVIGAEIPVLPVLAKTVGSMLVYYLISGSSVGEAFLSLRRHLLRQGNPLGLVYAFYALADLHIHTEPNCAWCNTHQARRGGTPHG